MTAIASFNLLADAGLAGGAWAVLWAAPIIVLASLVIAWAAESAQYRISQGLALAILALMQTLPEYTVEGTLAINAAGDDSFLHLMTANFTGALRLLVGLGFPLVFAVATVSHRLRQGRWRPSIRLRAHHAAEVLALVPPAGYLAVICLKASLTVVDAAVLAAMYVGYLWMMSLFPAEREGPVRQLEAIPRWVLNRPAGRSFALIGGMFALGGGLLFCFAEPFVHSMVAVSAVIGVNSYFMMQWVAPLLSEFPEKLSAFHWARRPRAAPVALMNMTSSIINEATLLVGLMPVAFCIARGQVAPIPLDPHQQGEILLTLTSALLAVAVLADQRFKWWEAAALLAFWAVGFFGPMFIGGEQAMAARHEVSPLHYWLTVAQLGWLGVEVILIGANVRKFRLVRALARAFRRADRGRRG
jgi:cation:H+ antiporter